MRLVDHIELLKNKQLELQKTKINPFFSYLKANAVYWTITGTLAVMGHLLPAGILAFVGGTASGAFGIMFCDDLFISKDSRGRNIWDKYHELNKKLEAAQHLPTPT